MIETLAYKAKGLPPVATDLAVERRYATSSSHHTFSILDEYSNNGSTMLAAANASETTLSVGVNNYN
jgi:hypothetical protein